jgi:tRNA pseudouridine55 synthase
VENQQRRKRRKLADSNIFKMGHGGTLDPLATGVLIVGIGRGTKHLNNFLDCTKSYETVVLFGKSTDTYDVAGKIVSDAPHSHITKDAVQAKLQSFLGPIKQVPPIYSALKIQGMKAYEYAKTGKELPRQLEAREMVVDECEMLEFYPGGEHDFRWPASEAADEDKAAARKLMERANADPSTPTTEPGQQEPNETIKSTYDPRAGKSAQQMSMKEVNRLPPSERAAMHTHEYALAEEPADGPAAKVRLTASKGFYVRSFAHDLGISLGSYGTMATLARLRQGDYTVADPPPENSGLIPCLTYQELEDEGIWGPKISQVLTFWIKANPARLEPQKDGRDRGRGPQNGWTGDRPRKRSDWNGGRKRKSEDMRQDHRVRNSSSPE